MRARVASFLALTVRNVRAFSGGWLARSDR
jgi:hypothetical protein